MWTLFSDILKHSHGNYTDKVIYRAGKIIGHLGKALDDIFLTEVAKTTQELTYTKEKDYSADIKDFVKQYSQEQLFDFIPGRCHASFPAFEYGLNKIKRPAELKKRLVKYARKIDRYRKTKAN